MRQDFYKRTRRGGKNCKVFKPNELIKHVNKSFLSCSHVLFSKFQLLIVFLKVKSFLQSDHMRIYHFCIKNATERYVSTVEGFAL